MAEALIQLVNQNVDIDGLTANEADVFDGATFIGQGSEAIREGTGVTQGAPTLGLSLNGRVTIPAGKYTGGKVQQSIQVLGEQRINPTSKNIKIPTKDMYMAGNIIVASIPNLKPENIKKGEYVGGVGPGTWEGYIVRDPATFYYRGTFAPGQSIMAFKYSRSSDIMSPNLGKKAMEFYGNEDSRRKYYVFLFNSPIDITSKSKLTVKGTYHRDASGTSTNMVLDISGYQSKASAGDTYTGLNTGDRVFLKQQRFPTAQGTYPYTVEVDISSYSRIIYLYFLVTMNRPDDYMTIDSIQFT
jgi:hypothetical protein